MRLLDSDSPPVDRLTEVSADIREAVTWSDEKADLYAVDQYFREACWTFGDIVPQMLGVALCMLKSEATAGRRLRPALRILREEGFQPVDAVRFRHDRLTIREVWRYQFNIASRERIEAMDAILPSTDTVALVLRDERWTPGALPAAVRLNALKGPADPALRGPQHLRHRLGVVNGLFNFTHISDEPADVLRELAVICDEPRRELVRQRILEGHNARPEVLAVFQDLERRHPEHDFDLEASWQRLAAVPGPLGEPARRRAQGEDPSLDGILALTHTTPVDDPHRWDLLTVVTHLLTEMNVPGVTPTVPNVTEVWRPGGRAVGAAS
ncbi:nucleoside-diphosphate kinase [Streptomyces sp. NBC_01408]|uniref:nucleoside-diphosphate kinase n=1 Tax=Streptomyces sp. NBC_01408 TaxID=2903855 RepID=UPI00224FE4CF|nr:nucleoside-diphosphate kinase [Streptomyces sp. NBC_01408]MCX4692837.1 hypothetical protein [Streptomyces sp. NBC_01408]